MIAATDEMVKSQFIEMFGDPIKNTKQWETLPLRIIAPEQPSNEFSSEKIWLLNLDMIESNTGKIIKKTYTNNINGLSVYPFDEKNVLFSKLRPYLNKVAIPDERGYATTELVPLRPNKDYLQQCFLSYLLRSDQFVRYANSIATGTKMPRMPLEELRNYQCILPPMELQHRFKVITIQAENPHRNYARLSRKSTG